MLNMDVRNKITSIVVFLIITLIALTTVKGQIEGNIIQLVVTIWLYIMIYKIIIHFMQMIQKAVNKTEDIIDEFKSK